jgi:hypothetical protein
MSNTNVGNVRGKFFGKYRGNVVENIDPMILGRLLINVPSVPANLSNWAMPCVPYAGPQVGFYAMPPIGANVWVEFEGGDPNYPIWVGCFWGEGEVPLESPPEQKVFKTEFNTFILSDIPEVGGMTLMSTPECVDDICTMKFDAEGIQITIPASSISMTGATISATTGDITLTAEEGIQATAGAEISAEAGAAMSLSAGADISAEAGAAIEITAGADISTEAGAAIEITAGADVAVTAGGAVEITGGADVAVTAGGAVEVTGGADVAVTAGGACEMTAGLDCAITAGLACEMTAGLACAITGATSEITAVGIAITGAVEVTGDLLIDGQQPLVI